MYRDEADLELLAELAGVLDATVTEAGLTSGTYLILRQLAEAGGPLAIMALAGRLSAEPDEVADLAGRLHAVGLARLAGTGISLTGTGQTMVTVLEERANVAIRDYVMERPHTATVYGLVAAMQSGRFTVADLVELIQQGPGATEPD